ncbi:MAG: hypothetical protein ACRYG7_45120 [Janthinobacterium lividum]
MERNETIKNVEKRIKEIAKDYESRGFLVSINPNQSELPQFLGGFKPDIIARSKQESVVIEVKTRETISDLKQFERLADLVAKREGWRFELVFTNPIEQNIQARLTGSLSIDEIKVRIPEIRLLAQHHHYEAAFLLGWATLEAAIRAKLFDDKVDSLNKPTLSIIKTLYSLGHVNKHDYQNLEQLNNLRNYLAHGFYKQIDSIRMTELLDVLTYLTGVSKETAMYEWLDSLDLDYYGEIYSLYTTVNSRESFGIFICEEDGDSIRISVPHIEDSLELKNEDERKQFLLLIQQEFMGDMDPESWYGFKQALEKDD